MMHDHPRWWVRALIGSAELIVLLGIVVLAVRHSARRPTSASSRAC